MSHQLRRSDKEYKKLGRMLESIYVTGGFSTRPEMLKMSLVRGIVTGFGGVLGATVLVALLLWVLSLFNDIPLLGPVLDTIQNMVESGPTPQ